jgi:RNA polymerase sigma-70 factor (family 1)
LLRLSNDDEKAFEFIYWKYNAHVYNFANSLLYSPKIAQDITQNVFLKIWEKRHEINPEQNFNAYLFTIARNMVYKETEQKLLAEQSLRQLQEEEDVLDMSTIQTLDYHFTEELCRSLVEELPPARREIFKLSRFERLSNKEIALRLSISERTVETQLYRATRFLKRKLLSDEGLGLLILLFIIQSN